MLILDKLACPQGEGREQLRQVDRWRAGIALLARSYAPELNPDELGVELHEENRHSPESTEEGRLFT